MMQRCSSLAGMSVLTGTLGYPMLMDHDPMLFQELPYVGWIELRAELRRPMAPDRESIGNVVNARMRMLVNVLHSITELLNSWCGMVLRLIT